MPLDTNGRSKFSAFFFNRITRNFILVLQQGDTTAKSVVNEIKNYFKELHQNGVKFPGDRNVFVPEHQQGCHDVTCKLAIKTVVPQFYI